MLLLCALLAALKLDGYAPVRTPDIHRGFLRQIRVCGRLPLACAANRIVPSRGMNFRGADLPLIGVPSLRALTLDTACRLPVRAGSIVDDSAGAVAAGRVAVVTRLLPRSVSCFLPFCASWLISPSAVHSSAVWCCSASLLVSVAARERRVALLRSQFSRAELCGLLSNQRGSASRGTGRTAARCASSLACTRAGSPCGRCCSASRCTLTVGLVCALLRPSFR